MPSQGIKQNKRAFFRYVMSKLTVRPGITEMKNEHSMINDTDEGIASIMVKYFNSILMMSCRK